MKANCYANDKGLELVFEDKTYSLEYPEKIWKAYPENLKKLFADNYAYLKALHLPHMLKNGIKISIGNPVPLFEKPIYGCMLNNVSFCSDVDGDSTEANLKKFVNLEFDFKDFETTYPKYDNILKEKAVLNMSFGKDSLCSFGLARELGLDPEPVFTIDNSTVRENNYKKIIINNFSKEFKKVWTVTNNTGVLHDYRYWKMPRTEWGYGHLMTELCFNILPFAHYSKAKYVLFGNEKSCDDYYINKDGYKCYPVFDQSSKWVTELTKMTKVLTNNQMQVVSLIEPIHELSVIKVLHNRYPEIGKYQMSCFPDENDYGKQNYWCEHCSKCARIFILLKANNIDPARVGFKTDMFSYDREHLFSCFGVEKKEGASIGYDTTGAGKDEQIYAFFLAYKNGARGELIDKFAKTYLNEAIEREDELHKKFYGIHDSKTIPTKFLHKLRSIFAEELE